MPLVALEILPQPHEWRAYGGTWRGNVFEVDPALVAIDFNEPLLVSPDFALKAGQFMTFTFSAYFGGGAAYCLHIVEGSRNRRVHSRLFEAMDGDARLSLAFRARKSGSYRLVLEHYGRPRRSKPTITAPSVSVQAVGAGAVRKGRLAELSVVAEESDDARYLPHWNPIQRLIHRRCRASRAFNNIVAAIEMRLGREELLSLPQYMGLCPTGQCNALCDFCSVTINRTGIIKKQLPYDRLENFLAPVTNTIQMYGIEGNGEPTLYTRFPELVERLTRGGARAYLITNGSRLQVGDVPLLLTLASVSFSLNAATAETHRLIMKLKNFEEIGEIIRALARDRGRPDAALDKVPSIYVSFVVTNDNVHEVQDFLRFADQDLGVDVVLVRPLAELGNDLGTVEDVRHIVPYESDVRDMTEAVREYMHDVPGNAEIRIAPETFRSVRPDPVGHVVMPRGFEGRLLAPRRDDWEALHPGVVAVWHLNSACLVFPAVDGELLRSQPVPVEPERELQFKAQIAVSGEPVRLLIEDGEHMIVAEAVLADTGGRTIPLELKIQTRRASALSFVLAGHGRAARLDIDFERLRTPAPYVSREFCIPPSRRWEVCVPGADVEWSDDVLRLRSATGGGPYLLKSYSVPCARDSTIELPVEVDVREGMIDIGVLDQAGAYLQTFQFASGHAASRVFFNTGGNDGVQLVLSAPPNQPLDAAIRWLKPRLIVEGDEELPIRLPNAPEWAACVPDLQIDRRADGVSLSWQGEGSPYLLKSNKVRCRPGRATNAHVLVRVEAGRLCLGVLDGTGARWLRTETVREGTHQVQLDFDADGSDGVFFVLSAVEGVPVTASIDLSNNGLLRGVPDAKSGDRESLPVLALAEAAVRSASDAPVRTIDRRPPTAPVSLAVPPRREEASPQLRNGPAEGDAAIKTPPGFPLAPEVPFSPGGPDGAPERMPAAAAQTFMNDLVDASPLRAVEPSRGSAARDRGPQPARKGSERAFPAVKRPATRTRYYCQKPWTDLHNFTVDGRMDVCCIATGASQERYQVGNLTRQTFQEIWNGPVMREFRRTVNSDNKLPPCARCPMSYAYQGFWFDPSNTRDEVSVLVTAILKKLRMLWLAGPAAKLCDLLLDHVVFRGFNRETRWMS